MLLPCLVPVHSRLVLPSPENLPTLSAPVNVWNTGNAAALSRPSALQIGSISKVPDTVHIRERDVAQR